MAQQPSNAELGIREYSRSNTHEGQRSRASRANKGKQSGSITIRTGSSTTRTSSTRPPESLQEPKEVYSFFGLWRKPKIAEAKPTLPESTPKHPNGSVVDLEDYFLQAAEESRIERDVNQLKYFISAHVDDHYSGLTTIPPKEVISNIVAKDNEAPPVPPSLLAEESVRLLVIKHCFARHIIECIAFDSVNSDVNTTFLPDDIISLLEMVPQPYDRGKHFVDPSLIVGQAELTSRSPVCRVCTATQDCRQPITVEPTSRKCSIPQTERSEYRGYLEAVVRQIFNSRRHQLE